MATHPIPPDLRARLAVLRRGRRRLAALLLALLLVSIPLAARANHRFSDAPAGSPYHNDAVFADAATTTALYVVFGANGDGP